MKIRQFISLFLPIILFSCAEDIPAPQVLKISEQNLHFSGNGGAWMLTINSNTTWKIEGLTDWCYTDKTDGYNTENLVVNVEANPTGNSRSANLRITSDRTTVQVSVEQDTISGSLHYELPVIFHIIYGDSEDTLQNVKREIITDIIGKCNALYQNSNGSIDMNLHLTAATHDPEGKELAEPGIHRIQRTNSAYKNSESFLKETNTIDGDLLWNPNQYVNVFVFTFVESNVAGRTTLPHTPRQNSLPGLIANNTFYTKIPNFPWGITLNNKYIYEPDNYQTMAHELGHYLGLLHVFIGENNTTDYCDDTYAYDRAEYEAYLRDNPNLSIQEKYQRKSTEGISFTSYNIMDYYYSYLNQFTADQFLRVRHVLEHSPLIPGPKDITVTRSLAEETETPAVVSIE